MIKRLTLFLGPARLRALFILIAGTGLVSLVLNAFPGAWVVPTQTILALACAVGIAIIFMTRMERQDQARWVAILLPALGAVILGAFFLPQFQLALVGAGVGWIVAGLFIFRARTPMQYQAAVKLLRKNDFAEAVKAMDAIIKDEPDKPQHYRFRAEILRVWGKLDRARRDYKKMTELAPDSPLAWNGLAEVQLQAGDYHDALRAAKRAYELAPDEWVAVYNLGMIEDRLGYWGDVVEHLEKAAALKVPDARHRLLIHLYLIRAYLQLGERDRAAAHLDALRGSKSGLAEWQTILSSDQATTLRAVIGADVEQARGLIERGLDALAEVK